MRNNGSIFFSDLKETIINRMNFGLIVVLVLGLLLGMMINNISNLINDKRDSKSNESSIENKIDFHFNLTTYSNQEKK